MKLSKILKYVGIIVGVLAALTLVSKSPINILILGLGALSYFIGVWLDKGKK
jgi:small-conductance mechanosensitive channel